MRYAFGQWVLDTDAHVLSRNGQKQELEPKAMAVLTHLVTHADRVVSRSELAEAGWPRQEVTDQTINRVIFVIRNCFREDDDVNIRTVHRKGYRLEAHPPVHVISNTPQVLTHKSSMRWLAPILVVLAVGLLVFAELFSKPAEPMADYSVGLMPVQAPSGKESERLLAYSINQALLLGLEQDPQLQLSQTEARNGRDFDAWVDQLDAAQLPVVLIEPVLQEENSDTEDHLNVWLHKKMDVGWQHFDLGMVTLPSPLLDERLANAARLSFVEQLHPLVLGLLGLLPFQQRAGDLESFNLYLKAVGSMQAVDCSDRRYIGLLETAVERSPDFDDARLGLAEAYFAQVWSCGQGREYLEKALAQTETVLRHDPYHSYALGLKSSLLASLGRASEAVALLREVMVQQPDDPSLELALSYVLTYVGDLQGSLALVQEAVAQDPLLLQVEVGDTPSVYFWLQDWEGLLKNSPYQQSSHILLLKAWAQWQLGKAAALQQTLAQLAAMDAHDRLGIFAGILAAVVQEDSALAHSRLQQLQLVDQQWPVLDGEQILLMAVLADLAGDEKLSRQWRRRARTQGFQCPACEQAFFE